jgi:tRNA (guanosine-2'-O-)-methyltransferase
MRHRPGVSPAEEKSARRGTRSLVESMPFVSPLRHTVPSLDARLVPSLVIGALTPHLSSQRRRRIGRVVAQRLVSVTVVLERLGDPHNGAAVLRTCEALGLHHVHVVPGPDGFEFAYKVTQRADKWIDVYRHVSSESCMAWLRRARFRCFAAVPPALGKCFSSIDVPVDQPVALVFGNEHDGLSEKIKASCDGVFHLPMFGFCQSLNLSVSVALALEQVTRARRQRLGRPGDLPDALREQLEAAFYARSCDCAAELVLRRLHDGR